MNWFSYTYNDIMQNCPHLIKHVKETIFDRNSSNNANNNNSADVEKYEV